MVYAIKIVNTNSLFILSVALLYFLLESRCPVSEALPIQRRKEPGIRRKSRNALMLPSGSGRFIHQTLTTPEHQDFMRVLFPTSSSIDKSIHKNPASYIRSGTMHSKYNYVLYIKPDGTVGGTSNDQSKYVRLEFHSVGHGFLMILGKATNKYLTITDDGRLIGQDQPSLNSVFKEEYMENLYQTFKSYKFQSKNWYVGIKRNGKAKRAQDTDVGQKATQFIIKYDDST